jgi:ankyrin repeat protein
VLPGWTFLAPLSVYQAAAAALLARAQTGDAAARSRFKWMHPRFAGLPLSAVEPGALSLDDARLVVARELACADWSGLAAHLAAAAAPGPVRAFEHAADAVVAGDLVSLQTLLAADPALVSARSSRLHRATLLHYLAANGAGSAPDALADAYGAPSTTLSLLVSSDHPRAAGLLVPLVEALLDHGADPDGGGAPAPAAQRPLLTALAFGALEAAEALARRGARVDTLAAAAGLGRLDAARALLAAASAAERHRALALAAQHGRAELVALFLDAGEDPSRYNPPGLHAHATPLHEAALGGHLATARLLVERGARLELEDLVYGATPLGWARHGGQAALAGYLEAAARGV